MAFISSSDVIFIATTHREETVCLDPMNPTKNQEKSFAYYRIFQLTSVWVSDIYRMNAWCYNRYKDAVCFFVVSFQSAIFQRLIPFLSLSLPRLSSHALIPSETSVKTSSYLSLFRLPPCNPGTFHIVPVWFSWNDKFLCRRLMAIILDLTLFKSIFIVCHLYVAGICGTGGYWPSKNHSIMHSIIQG